MPTSARRSPSHVLVDTSAAVALVQRTHPFHEVVRARLKGNRLGLAGHAAVEFLSVLTRLPSPYRLTPAAALRMQQTNFPESLFLSAETMDVLLPELVSFGLAGGAFYDGLVGAAAREHDLPLITCDRRAEATYRALGVSIELLA